MTPLTKMVINDPKWLAYRQKNWPLFSYLKEKAKLEISKAKSLWVAKIKNSTQGLWILKIVKPVYNELGRDREKVCYMCKENSL